jgi:signal transduction histidine kinase/AraC-like DNA-binding protein/ABC-type sugar transport system substrate-binding protein
MPASVRATRLAIGVLTGWQYYWTATPLSYLEPLLSGMRLAAQRLGCNLLLGCGLGVSATPSDPLRPAWPIPTPGTDFVPIGPWNTNGLIAVTPLHLSALSRDIQAMIADGHPVQFVGSGERGPTISADNASGIMEAMAHLVGHGHRRIAFIAGSPEDRDGDSGDRLRAYEAALRVHKLPFDPRLIAYGRHVYAAGYAAMGQILAGGAPFTAVLASNDESALGAIQALGASGRRIPHDVAVIGFDDRPESSVQQPTLSSVRIPLLRMGYRAVELLVQTIGGGAPAESVRVPTRLVPRESCGCGHDQLRSTPVIATHHQPAHASLAVALTAAVFAQAQVAAEAEIAAACAGLVAALTTSAEQAAPLAFLDALDAVLRDPAFVHEQAHIWQAALSALRPAAGMTPAQLQTLIDQSRLLISAQMQRQHRQYAVNRQWLTNRLGVLTAQLQLALDEAQAFSILAHHLQELAISSAWLALFATDTTAHALAPCTLRSLLAPHREPISCLARDFPPAALLSGAEALGLAVVPLVTPKGQLGFVAFDGEHLELYGTIVQQLAAALHTAQLYREATEGRRLAEEADQLKTRFLSTVSHELRTPLNLIVGLSQLLVRELEQAEGALPERYRDDLERINANAQHLGGLIGDVLDLASSDAGQLRLSNEYVNLSEALRMVAETGERLARDKGLVWSADLPEHGPWVWGDQMRLRQVALNLVSNAVKFTARGFVRLTVATEGEYARVSVIDSGLGIPPEEQSAIFAEFRRSDRSFNRGYAGLGLGLAISRRLVELHGGSMSLASSGREGEGSAFWFALPVVEPPHAPAPDPGAEGDGDRLLVLSEAGAQLLDYLRGRGFEVQLASTIERAAWPGAEAPSAVVLDLSGRPERGWELLKALKSSPAARDIPLLLYSQSVDGGAVLELDYLTKPVELSQLTDALDQLQLSDDPDSRVVLVVDDDLGTLDLNARIVHGHWPGARVLKAANGRAALASLAAGRVDLVLLDLIMPELDGFELLEAMRQVEAMRNIPVIVLTGQDLSQQEIARLDRGVASVMRKGLFSPAETLAHLDAALERRRKLSGEAQRLVRQAMAYIHERYADPIARSDLARHVGMAEDYLTSCFHKEVGMTPIAYLNRYRIAQAKLLLTASDTSIGEVAAAVGFADSGYFSRMFRREVGVAPEAYRRTHA